MNNTDFSNRLKDLRIQKGLKQKEIANALGFTTATYNRYEKGVSMPKADNILALANFFDVSPDFLLYGSNYNTSQKKQHNNNLLELYPTVENIEKYPEYFDYLKDSIVKILNESVVRYNLKTKEKIIVDKKMYDEFPIDTKAKLLSTIIHHLTVDQKNNVIEFHLKLPLEYYDLEKI